MSMTLPTQPTTATKPHIVTREFNAPRDLMWDVCSQAHHLASWFAPANRKGFVKSLDFRVGGVNHYCQTAPDGSDAVWGRAVYTEISPKDRIAYVMCFSDEAGNITSHPMAPGWPRLMHCIYRFEAIGPKRTRLTVEFAPAEDSSPEAIALFDSARAGMDGGWSGTFDNLENYLASLKP